jgi:hypothetical protein
MFLGALVVLLGHELATMMMEAGQGMGHLSLIERFKWLGIGNGICARRDI